MVSTQLVRRRFAPAARLAAAVGVLVAALVAPQAAVFAIVWTVDYETLESFASSHTEDVAFVGRIVVAGVAVCGLSRIVRRWRQVSWAGRTRMACGWSLAVAYAWAVAWCAVWWIAGQDAVAM